jgi:hypothetical protein
VAAVALLFVLGVVLLLFVVGVVLLLFVAGVVLLLFVAGVVLLLFVAGVHWGSVVPKAALTSQLPELVTEMLLVFSAE